MVSSFSGALVRAASAVVVTAALLVGGIAPGALAAGSIEGRVAAITTQQVPEEEPVLPDREGDAATVPPGRQARLNVGIGRTVYLYLTRNEQTILASGGAAAIAAMACISLGPAGCIGVSAAVASAATYVAIHGFCPSRLEIAIGRGYKCVR